MMKSILLKTALLCAVVMGLAACGVGQAQAGTLPQNLVADNGVVFQVANAVSFEKVPGAINVRQINYTVYSFPDATGAVYNKAINSVAASGHFMQAPGTLLHVNTTLAMSVTCAGNASNLFYAQTTMQPLTYADNCALYNAIRTQSS